MKNALRAICITAFVLSIVFSCDKQPTIPEEIRLSREVEMRAEPPCIEVICIVDSAGAVLRCDTLECN